MELYYGIEHEFFLYKDGKIVHAGKENLDLPLDGNKWIVEIRTDPFKDLNLLYKQYLKRLQDAWDKLSKGYSLHSDINHHYVPSNILRERQRSRIKSRKISATNVNANYMISTSLQLNLSYGKEVLAIDGNLDYEHILLDFENPNSYYLEGCTIVRCINNCSKRTTRDRLRKCIMKLDKTYREVIENTDRDWGIIYEKKNNIFEYRSLPSSVNVREVLSKIDF